MSIYTYFWRGPFSQWTMRKSTDSFGNEYNCCEQYMMAKKAELFKDHATRAKIILAPHPREQQYLGRLVSGYNQKIWDDNKLQIVYEGNMFKYQQHEDLRIKLFNTTGTALVEASPKDAVWGIGLDVLDADKTDPKDWPGKNYLGKILTIVRDDIKKGIYTTDIKERFRLLGWL